eukprot:14602181-Heterocapsa_arctica.AAC.1
MPNKSTGKLWQHINPGYKGKVGRAVVDLGTTHRTHTKASINKETKSILSKQGQSRATYGEAVDPFTQSEINILSRFAESLWPNKFSSCKATGLLLVDKGELEPGVA